MKIARYLASVSNKIGQYEMETFKDQPIWPKEDLANLEPDSNEKIQRFIARDLYTPSTIHRELGLPLISWKGWSDNSPEGMYSLLLFNFSLQEISLA